MFNLRVIFLTLSILLFCLPDFALPFCSNIDHRKELPANTRDFFKTSRNQGDSGWCYAYAAADVISNQVEVPVSALAIAVNYNENIDFFGHFWRWGDSTKGVLDGGFIEDALQESSGSNGFGWCPEDKVSSKLNGPSFKDKMVQLNLSLKNQIFKDEQISYLQTIFKTLSKEQILNILNTEAVARKKSAQSVLKKLVDLACLDPNTSEPHRWTAQSIQNSLENSFKLMNQIDNELPQTIIGFLYNTDFLYIDDDTNFISRITGDHVSTIWGRQLNEATNECELLIRDSFGNDCTQYKPGIHCEGDGWLWIPQSKIKEKIKSITFVN